VVLKSVKDPKAQTVQKAEKRLIAAAQDLAHKTRAALLVQSTVMPLREKDILEIDIHEYLFKQIEAVDSYEKALGSTK
jgi:phosphoribosylformylglycinamidine (FGAM) synthase PurS component